MSTGSLIRNFAKDDRELRYANSGSIRITDVEHNAYRLSLTLEITHISAPRYGNRKTLPDNTHYGYLTYFKGSTVTKSEPVKFPKFRVFDIINQGIWSYHQSTEITQLLAGTTQSTAEASTNFIQSKVSGWLDEILGNSFCSVVQFLDDMPESWDTQANYSWLLNVAGCDDSDAGKLALASDYRGFPVASPFPTVVKFKSDVPVSFLWRLEAWYLANPETYTENSPIDSDDQTDGEDEYPTPDFSPGSDGSGGGASGFPNSDAVDPDSDPRDYGSDSPLPSGNYSITISWKAIGASGGWEDGGTAFSMVLEGYQFPLIGDVGSTPSPYVSLPGAFLGVYVLGADGSTIYAEWLNVTFLEGSVSVEVIYLD